MITLTFLSGTPFCVFEAIYRTAFEEYESAVIRYNDHVVPGHIIVEIYHRGLTVEQIEADIAPYTHWFTAEESA
jgi:hypothetical protein